MSYEEFKEELLNGLRDYYGKDAEVDICAVRKNNGNHYDGAQIIFKKTDLKAVPVIRVTDLYEAYSEGSMEMLDCVEEICRKREKYEASDDLLQFAEEIMNWETVRKHVYPILLSTKENQEMLEELVSTPMLDLDLTVAYIIRMNTTEGERASVKVKKTMLDEYGIQDIQLHEQAMKNLEEDGYEFQDVEAFILQMFGMEHDRKESSEGEEENIIPEKMYVLTNESISYGAAGILYKKLLQEFAGKRNFFILPSSIHETIFVPACNLLEREFLDSMVEEVNKTQVDVEEQLSNHCYYYDGQTGEIRMCA